MLAVGRRILLAAGLLLAFAGALPTGVAQDDLLLLARPPSDLGALGGFGILQDQDVETTETTQLDQEVDMDIERTMLGRLLILHGANDVTWDALRDVTVRADRETRINVTSDVDRDAVFSALALGVAAEADRLDALAVAANVNAAVPASATLSQSVDLDVDLVLMNIILAEASGEAPSLAGVASVQRGTTARETRIHDVALSLDDTLLLLTLGAGA